MGSAIEFKRDRKGVKKQLHLKNCVFLIYATKKLTPSPFQFNRYDTEVTVTLPKDSRGNFTSKFKTDKIEHIFDSKRKIWMGILNRLLTEEIVIKRDRPLGFLS